MLTAACTTDSKNHDNVKVRNKSAKSSETKPLTKSQKGLDAFLKKQDHVHCKDSPSKCDRLLLQLLLLLLNISKNNIETKSWQPLIAAAATPTDAATAAAVCEV